MPHKADLQKLISMIQSFPLRLRPEDALQQDLAALLTRAGISHKRECTFSDRSRADFLCMLPDTGEIVIECKARKGWNAVKVAEQLVRYERIHGNLSAIVLVATRKIPGLTDEYVNAGGRIMLIIVEAKYRIY